MNSPLGIPKLGSDNFFARLTTPSKSHQAHSSGNNVIAIYPYIETNPYQKLLSEALEKGGYKIRKLSRIDSTVPSELVSRCRDVRVVHFHWIEHLYESRIRLFSPVRAAVLLGILVVLRRRGTRIVYTLHNLVPHNIRRQWFHLLVQGLIIRMADATIVHSRPANKAASSMFGPSDKFKVIPHGRYDSFYPNQASRAQARAFLKIPEGKNVALFLGGMGRYKGVRMLLESAEELARKDILLVLAGDTSALEVSTRDFLQRMSHKNLLLHEGFVAKSQVQYFMKSANCLVLPYLDSLTSGMAFLGLSFRLPIVGTRATAFQEMTEARLCLPCDPNNPKSLAEAIAKVCSWDRPQFEKRCEDFLAACKWDEIADQHLRAYGFHPAKTASNRRNVPRAKISLPIRVRPFDPIYPEEICTTLDMSKSGLFFATPARHYSELQLRHMKVHVMRNFQPNDAANREEVGDVVRVVGPKDGKWGVAIQFATATKSGASSGA